MSEALDEALEQMIVDELENPTERTTPYPEPTDEEIAAAVMAGS